jgi:hypothetical protein
LSKKFIDFFHSNLLILGLELLLIKAVKVEIALMLFGITVLRAEYVLATALNAQETDLLLAVPALGLVILMKRNWLELKIIYSLLNNLPAQVSVVLIQEPLSIPHS